MSAFGQSLIVQPSHAADSQDVTLATWNGLAKALDIFQHLFGSPDSKTCLANDLHRELTRLVKHEMAVIAFLPSPVEVTVNLVPTPRSLLLKIWVTTYDFEGHIVTHTRTVAIYVDPVN